MNFRNHYFDLTVQKKSSSVVLQMQFTNGKFTTKDFPKTYAFLKLHAPSVLKTKCFNPKNVCFSKEVIDTQMAHLFEHILLTYLCDEDIKSGSDKAKYGAVTKWNWKINPKGSFTIEISRAVRKKLLEAALIRAIALTELLIKNHEIDTVPVVQSLQQQPLRRPLPQSSVQITH